MGDIVLETERLILRAISEGDAALQDRVLNTPAVMEHLGGVQQLHEIEAMRVSNKSITRPLPIKATTKWVGSFAKTVGVAATLMKQWWP